MSTSQAQDNGKPVRQTSLLYQIDTAQITKVWLQSLQRDARGALLEEKIAHRGVVIAGNQVQVNLRDASQIDLALARVKKLVLPIDAAVTGGENGVIIIIEPTAAGLANRIETALSRTVEIVRRRVDADGTGEVSVEPRRENRILIQVPEQAAAEVKARVSVTAKLTFHLVDVSLAAERAQTEGVPPDDLLLPDLDHPGRSVLVHKEVLLSGDDLVDAQGSHDWRSVGEPAVAFEFNIRGAVTFARVTRENIGKPFAIVLDNKVISAPVIRSDIPGGRGVITGNFGLEEANRLALLLRSGALPAALSLIEERTGEP